MIYSGLQRSLTKATKGTVVKKRVRHTNTQLIIINFFGQLQWELLSGRL